MLLLEFVERKWGLRYISFTQAVCSPYPEQTEYKGHRLRTDGCTYPVCVSSFGTADVTRSNKKALKANKMNLNKEATKKIFC